MELRLNEQGDARSLSEFYLGNASHFSIWEPQRESDFHSVDSWCQRLQDRKAEFDAGISAHFITYDTLVNKVVATCSLTNIARGPFQAGNLGYAVSKDYEGMGLMKQLCKHVIAFAFEELELNRIMANYMPNNFRSEGLLKSLDFEREGFARKYLYINGAWEDHVLTSLVNPLNR